MAIKGKMTDIRKALAGQRARRGVMLIVLAVLTVQFGLIQHVIDAGPQHVEATCGLCVTGDHNAPLIMDADGGEPSLVAAPVKALHPVPETAAPGSAAHRVRGPPRTA